MSCPNDRKRRKKNITVSLTAGEALHLGLSEVEGLTSIRYDIVSLLVIGSEKVFLRHHKKALNDRR